MKIGDKVRFLNEVGGGIVVGFEGNKTVIVQDESGFDIPFPIHEVIAVETNDYNIAKVNTRKSAEPTQVVAAPPTEVEPADRPVTFKAKPQERRGAELLNLYLAFLPAEAGSETLEFEAYWVNDSNYYVRYLLLKQEGKAFSVRHEGLIEPNTKCFIETFDRSELEQWEQPTIQALAYKTDRTFLLKSPLSVTLRLEGSKFYKQHTFKDNDFFDEPALLFDVVRDDKLVRTVFVDAEQLKEAILDRPQRPQKAPARKEKADRNAVIEIDLHAAEVLETTAGMQPKDILDYQLDIFRKAMEEHKQERGRKLVFIHGKGNGVLRNAIVAALKRDYKTCTFQDASFQEYGYGATLVKC